MFESIASKIKKTKNGRPTGPHPTGKAVKRLLDKVDDPDWFPGRFDSDGMGRPHDFSPWVGRCCGVGLRGEVF